MDDSDCVSLGELLIDAGDQGEWPSPPLACRIGISICEQLHAMHAPPEGAGQVHGGLIVSMVMVHRDGAVRVAAFPPGLESMGEQSPEQLEGAEADVRSDVWAAGLLLYYLLSGGHPFPGEDEDERVQATLAGKLVPPSQLGPELLPPGKARPIPGALEAAVLKAMARAPQQRFESALAMQRALEAALSESSAQPGQVEIARFVRVVSPPDRPGEPADSGKPRNVAELMALVESLSPKPDPPRDIKVFYDDARVPRGADSPAAIARVAELLDLGFTRLGVKVEVGEDGHEVPTLSFGSAARGCFAEIFFSGASGVVPHLYFFTVFQSGEVVVTRAYSAPSYRAQRVVKSSLLGKPLGEVLELHRRELAAMEARGALPYSRFGREEQLLATNWYYRSPDTPK